MTQEHAKQPVIAVGHDGSERGADALALGALIARTVGGRLVVGGWYREEFPVFPGSDDLENDLRRLVLEGLQRIQTGVLGVPVELRAVRGRSPAQALHRLAGRKHADLVVVGPTPPGPARGVPPRRTRQRGLREG